MKFGNILFGISMGGIILTTAILSGADSSVTYRHGFMTGFVTIYLLGWSIFERK